MLDATRGFAFSRALRAPCYIAATLMLTLRRDAYAAFAARYAAICYA